MEGLLRSPVDASAGVCGFDHFLHLSGAGRRWFLSAPKGAGSGRVKSVVLVLTGAQACASLCKLLPSLVETIPVSILILLPLDELDDPFSPHAAEQAACEEFMRRYRTVPVKQDGSKAKLGLATQALQASCHPALLRFSELDAESRFSDDDENDDNDSRQPHAHRLAEWREELRQSGSAADLCHMQCFLNLFQYLRNNFPRHWLLIFSASAIVLDIVEMALQGRFGVRCLQYEGSMSASSETMFVRPSRAPFAGTYDKPMLITAGAGGVGLILLR